MILEEFLVMLGAETETEKVEGFGAALSKVATIGAVVVTALKTVTMAAWAFADSYVRRAEELYNSNDSLVKITKEQVEMSKKYEEGMGKLGDIIESVKIRIAFGFLPTMLNMVETFNKFLDANKDLIANGITKLLDAVALASQVINNTVRFIVKIIEKTIGWKGALIALIAVFAWLKRAMILAFITNPITWVIAAIVGLMLLIDDFMTYLDGGESQFGEFWGAMLGWVDENKDALKAMWDALVAGFGYLVQIGGYIATYLGGAFKEVIGFIVALVAFLVGLFTGDTELMKVAWQGMVDHFLAVFQNFAMLFEPLARLLLDIISAVWDAIVTYVSDKITQLVTAIQGFISSLSDALSNVFDIVTAPFAKAFDWISNKFSSLGSMISGAISGAASLVGIGASSAAPSNSTSSSVVNVNAPISVTSSDPHKAAKLTQQGMGNTVNNATRNQGSKVKI